MPIQLVESMPILFLRVLGIFLPTRRAFDDIGPTHASHPCLPANLRSSAHFLEKTLWEMATSFDHSQLRRLDVNMPMFQFVTSLLRGLREDESFGQLLLKLSQVLGKGRVVDTVWDAVDNVQEHRTNRTAGGELVSVCFPNITDI